MTKTRRTNVELVEQDLEAIAWRASLQKRVSVISEKTSEVPFTERRHAAP